MRVKLNLLRAGGPTADLVVTMSATATVGEVAHSIVVGDPARPQAGLAELMNRPYTLQVHRRGLSEPEFLMPNKPVGEVHLGSGLAVSIVELDPSRDWSRQKLAEVEATVRAVSGPDEGAVFTLDSDTNVVGRDADCDIVLTDQMVSKRHARIELEPGLVRFIDLNSANGIVVDGGTIDRIDLIAGARITLGQTELEITQIRQTKAGTGVVSHLGETHQFNRSPQVSVRFPGEELDSPQLPADETGQGFPWLIMIAPLLMGVVLYAFTKSLLSVVFVSLSPLLMVGNYFSTRSERRRKRRESIATFKTQLAKLDSRLAALQVDERAIRLAESPSLFDIVQQSEAYEGMLWTRRPEHWSFLTVRLGIGKSLSRTKVRERSIPERALPDFPEQAEEVAKRYEFVDGVPIIESFKLSGGIGVAGDSAGALPYSRGLLAQIAGLYSPAEVVISAIVDPRLAGEFEWLKWLPHTSSPQSPFDVNVLGDTAVSCAQFVSALEELVDARAAGAEAARPARKPPIDFEESIDGVAKTSGTDEKEEKEDPSPIVIVLVAGELPVDRGRLIQILERGADHGVHAIWLAESPRDIPAVCRTFVTVNSASPLSGSAGFVREGRHVDPVALEGLAADRSEIFAKSLAPVIDSSSYTSDDSDLPPSVSFLEIVGKELAEDPAAVIDRWNQNESIIDRKAPAPVPRRKPGKLRAFIGQAGADAMHLDLRTQGPHALVGGTTGSGKSEFLQAWVLGMAAEYSPDRVTFLFVDYKGGSAFADCVRLPHCVGLVTDLNTHLVRRALTSLKAEIHYREHLLNKKKAKDLLDLERRGDPDAPPALVIVIDEFAALANEIPEFVDGVVDIAQRGRSLGIHLIMATQRPSGVIKDNLRANTNLRIALRMADETDSADVIGISVAATFDPSLPGRGVAKTGPGRLTTFQSGYAGGWTTTERTPARIDLAELGFGQGRVWGSELDNEPNVDSSGPNDTARLVDNFLLAAKKSAIPAPRKPWLDELAPIYDLGLLRQRTDAELMLGVSDDPNSQSQIPAYFRPDIDGNIAIFGTGGSGKTMVLRTLTVAAGITPRGGPVEVYGLDFAAGGLRILESLPHVGAIIAGDDGERVTRLFTWLRALVDDRAERYSTVNANGVEDYRKAAGKPDEPRILLLVDGMASFRTTYEYTGSDGVFTALQQILSDGRAVGVHVALTADRPGSISPAVSASIQRRVALRLADENDYALLDIGADVLTATSPAGRGVVDGLETQIAILGGRRSLADQAKAIEGLAQTMRANGVRDAPPVERLAEVIPHAAVAGKIPGLLPIGIADDTLEPVGISPTGTFMVSGPPVSGRTSALISLVTGLAAQEAKSTFSYIGTSRSPVGQLGVWKNKATDADAAAKLAKALLPLVEVAASEAKKQVIVIESIADLLSTGADTELAAVIKAARRNDHFVIAESESSTWSQSWPLLMEVKSGRRGFSLQPDQMEGDMLYKTAFPRAKRSDFPAGRGWLVEAGRVRKVQLAVVE
jgi:DNA segregation ATPase FtsK/SpoIIIE, S-DNA-T family